MTLLAQVQKEKARRGIQQRTNAAAIGLVLRSASALYKTAKAAKNPAVRAKAIKAAAAAYRMASSAIAKIAKMIRGAGPKGKTLAKKLGPQRKKLAKVKRLQYNRIHSLVDKKKNPTEYAKVRRAMGIKPRAGIRKPATSIRKPIRKAAKQSTAPAAPVETKVGAPLSKRGRAMQLAKRVAKVPGAGLVGGLVGEMVAEKAIEKALTPKKPKQDNKKDNKEPNMKIVAKVAITTRIKTNTTKLLNSIGAEITKQKKRNTRLQNQLVALQAECKKIMQKGGAKAPKLLAELRARITETQAKHAKESAMLRRLQVQHAQLLKQADLNQNAI